MKASHIYHLPNSQITSDHHHREYGQASRQDEHQNAHRRYRYYSERVDVAYFCFQNITTFAAKNSTSDEGIIL
jgi:hypothetical protein